MASTSRSPPGDEPPDSVRSPGDRAQGRTRLGRLACDDEPGVPSRRTPTGRRSMPLASSPLRAMIQAITAFEFHISPVPISSVPRRAVEPALRCREPAAPRLRHRLCAAGCRQLQRDRGCARRARPEPRSGRSETAEPSGFSDGPLGDDATPLAAEIRGRSLLDHELLLREVDLQCGVIEVKARAVLDRRLSPLRTRGR